METSQLRHTALTARHELDGARMAPFAGWLMPLSFAGTVAEHQAVRSGVGVFDVSHLGTVWVTGDGALETVSSAFTNDPRRLDDASSQYTLCCDDGGGVIDDLIVYRLTADRLLAVPNAANTAAVVAALRRAAGDGVDVRDESTAWAVIAVQGPDALAATDAAHREATGHSPDTAGIPHLGIREVAADDGTVGYVGRTGYTGEVGCELVIPNDRAEAVWSALLDGGATPAGLGARDTLRLEMGFPLHGNELSADTDPYEARLGWAVKLDHGEFAGRAALRERKESGADRRLLGLRASTRRPLRAGATVVRGSEAVGEITSGGFSPALEVGIGLAYLDDPVGPGDDVTVELRGRQVAVEVVRPPFVARDPKGSE